MTVQKRVRMMSEEGGQQTDMNAETFFAEKPHEWKLYTALCEKLEQQLGSWEIRVQKTQITFANVCVFACVSLKWKNCLTVTFGLPDRVDSPRIHHASEPYPNRWTHHVKVYAAEELDEELLGWITAAYVFAGMKQKR